MNPTPFSPQETKQRAQTKTLAVLRVRLAERDKELVELKEALEVHLNEHGKRVAYYLKRLDEYEKYVSEQNRRVDLLINKFGNLEAFYQAAIGREQRLERDLANLKTECAARLEKFGKHKTECAARMSPVTACTCGLAEAKVFV